MAEAVFGDVGTAAGDGVAAGDSLVAVHPAYPEKDHPNSEWIGLLVHRSQPFTATAAVISSGSPQ